MPFFSTSTLRALETSLIRAFERPLTFHVAVLGLVAAYGLIRVTLLGALGGDEAEQVLFAQSWQWGYDVTNPPLYTWLLGGAFWLFGTSAAVVVALKLTVLGLIYIALYHTALIALGAGRRKDAVLVGLSPVLFFFVAWQAVFSYSHALLYALFAVLTFMALLKAVQNGGWRWFVMLGLVMGLGVLTKYSYLLFLAALFAAALTLPAVWARLLNGRLAVAAGIGAAVFLPHALWLMEHMDKLVALTEYKLEVEAGLPYLQGAAKGLWNMARALFAFVSPLWVIALALFPMAFAFKSRAGDSAGGESGLTAQWLGRAYLFALLAMAGMVLLGGITQFRPNYLFFFILAPLWLFARLPETYRSGKRLVFYGRAIALCGFLSVAVLLGKGIVDPIRCKKCQNYVPYAQIAQALKDAGFTRGTIFAHWYPFPLPGNLALYLPEARIVSQKFPYIRPPATGARGQCLLVWPPLEQGGQDTQKYLEVTTHAFQIPQGFTYEVKRLKIPLDRAPDKYVLVDYAFLETDQGDCR